MWTEKRLRELKQQGRIKAYTIPVKNYSTKNGKNIPPQPRSKAKEWLSWNLPFWANEHSLQLETEFQFDEIRKWRFDFALPAVKIAIEYEGIFSDKSRHTSVKGYTGDAEKYNRAQALAWKVIRLTAMNYKTVLTTLNDCLKQ